MLRYSIVLEWDEEAKAFGVSVPSLPGCYSQGDTIEEAVSNAREAIEGHIAALIEMGQDVPPDTEAQVIRIDVPSPAEHQAA